MTILPAATSGICDRLGNYHRLGNYMLQIEDLGFELVLTTNNEECGPPDAIWRAHRANIPAEQGDGVDGFIQNKAPHMLAGGIADLARRIPNATFADVLPQHLLPPTGIQLVPVPQPVQALPLLPALSNNAPDASTSTAVASYQPNPVPLSRILLVRYLCAIFPQHNMSYRPQLPPLLLSRLATIMNRKNQHSWRYSNGSPRDCLKPDGTCAFHFPVHIHTCTTQCLRAQANRYM
jgi:hypothetical protein